jgi:predicted nucleic acid-binding protein
VLVIADSSPLIYLSRVGALHVLPALFDEVAVPRAVWDETVERRPSAPGIDALHQASWLRVVDNPSLQLDLGLDPGETAAILVAESLRADLLLIDERVGRKVARARGLSVRGHTRRARSGATRTIATDSGMARDVVIREASDPFVLPASMSDSG